jgi:hypothetical protein
MRNIHLWNLLALHVPNPLPETVFGSRFPRPAGRLLWSTLMFTAGCVIAYVLIKRPKKSDEPPTWVQAIVGAMFVWAMFALGYGVIPHEWLNFGNSYLNFDSSTYLLQRNSVIPTDITRDKFVDAVAALIYVVVLVLNVYFFAAWQKRKVAEPVTEGEGSDATVTPITGGVFGRLRRPKRTSAYGRPVTTSD